jgi:hypothetical protein
MLDVSKHLMMSVVFLAGLYALDLIVATQLVVADQTPNPHSDLIFRATGADSCRDCHGIEKNGSLRPRPLENDLVMKLRDKAKGIHGPGRFADCLRCHAGGMKGVEKYSR